METNHRSAQSILSSATTNGNTTNNSSPPSHSLSRRASFTSCEVNSLNNDEGILQKNLRFSHYLSVYIAYKTKHVHFNAHCII